MKLDERIGNLAKEREEEQSRKSNFNKEVADKRMAAKRAAFIQIRDKFKRFEDTEISDSLRVTFGEWGATIDLRDTTYTTLWTRIWPFRSEKAIFNSKPPFRRWKFTAVIDGDGQVQWSVESIRGGRGVGQGSIVPRRDLNRRLTEIEESIAMEVVRQREGFYEE